MACLATLAVTLLFSTTVSAVSTTVAYPQPSQSCVSGVHMIVARASLENQGIGILQDVVKQIQQKVPNSDAAAVVYPATENDYVFSEQEGVVGMKQLVTDYVSKCPNGKIALLGYSQGAQVVGDTVIGSDETNFSDDTTNPTGLGSQYLDPIVALIMMGDPAFKLNMPGHVGNATKSGLFPRNNVDAFSKYGLNNKMQTYCDDGDEFCSGGTGKNALLIHAGYVGEYGSSAAAYVASKFSAAGPAATGSSGGSSNRPASTSASPTMSSGGGSSMASAASKPATTSKSNNPLTSQRYHPATGTFSGTFGELGNLAANDGGVHTMERGVAGVVFGAAMFIMGMF